MQIEWFDYLCSMIIYAHMDRDTSRMKIPCLPYTRLYQDSMDRLQEYQAAQTLDEPADSPVLDQEIHQAPTKWRPPCGNIYKANFDGAVFQGPRVTKGRHRSVWSSGTRTVR